MKYFLCILILSASFGQNAFAEKDTMCCASNVLYGEVAGIGGYGSVNYERAIFRNTNLMYALRIGISTYRIKDYTNKINPDVMIPLALNVCYGQNHKIELGIGQTIANIVRTDFTDFTPKRETAVHTNFNVGYRFQKSSGGFMFRCSYTPIIEFNREFRHWAGFSIGFSF